MTGFILGALISCTNLFGDTITGTFVSADRVSIMLQLPNEYGFDGIPFPVLQECHVVTTAGVK